VPITRISGERANNTNKIYPEKTGQPSHRSSGHPDEAAGDPLDRQRTTRR
jgi:hypothetical protein